MQDTNKLIYTVLEPAINDWFIKQCRNPSERYYLYIRKAHEGEKISIPIIDTKAPNEFYFLAMNTRVSPAWTKQQAISACHASLRSQPILGNN